jgi:hypothetical protein
LRTHNLKKRFDNAQNRGDLTGMLEAVDALIAMHEGDKKVKLALVALKSRVLGKTWRLKECHDLLEEHTCVPSGDLDEQGRELMQSLRTEKRRLQKRLSLRASASDSELFMKSTLWQEVDVVARLEDDAVGSLEIRSLSEPNILTPRNVVVEVREGEGAHPQTGEEES